MDQAGLDESYDHKRGHLYRAQKWWWVDIFNDQTVVVKMPMYYFLHFEITKWPTC